MENFIRSSSILSLNKQYFACKLFAILLVVINLQSCFGVFFANGGDVLLSYNVTNITVCRTDTNSFQSILGSKLSDCVQECGLRQHCKALSYGRKLQMCKLFLSKDDAHFINEDCVYVTDDDIKVERVTFF